MRDSKKNRRHLYWIVAAIACAYFAIIAFSFRYLTKGRSVLHTSSTATEDSARSGRDVFEHTAIYAPKLTHAEISCGSCHANIGRQSTAIPMIDVVSRFPQFSARAGRVITLQDRVRECFVRSENGQPPGDGDPTMRNLLAYFQSLSTEGAPHKGKAGLTLLPSLTPDAEEGRALYHSECSGCHGSDGQGMGNSWPPLWGELSFNDGAGMYQIPKLAAFIKSNMPENRKGILSSQQAYDIAEFIHERQRPKMNPAYAKY